jgi:hypothetical protein
MYNTFFNRCAPFLARKISRPWYVAAFAHIITHGSAGTQTQRIAVILTPWANVLKLDFGILHLWVEKYCIIDT